VTPDEIKRKLREACALVGFEEVAESLSISAAQLNAWIASDDVMPPEKIAALRALLENRRPRG